MEGRLQNGAGMELGRVNPAFVNDSDQLGTDSDFQRYNGLPTVTSADETQNVDGKVTTSGDEESGPQRQQWTNGTDFIMSCIAKTIGLGKIWRFPYIVFYNGGVAFLIPYFVAHMLIGKPLYKLEMCIGQFVSGGPVKVWELSPALQGIGYGQMFATLMVLLIYCFYMAVSSFYLVQSFAAEFPWSRCFEEWENCFSFREREVHSSYEESKTPQSSAYHYFYRYVLNRPDSIEDGIGDPDWRLTYGLLFAWVTLLVVVVRGVRSSGKAAYFLAVFPYLLITALLIRGATLPGAEEGIIYYLKPRWEKLLEAQVWYEAVTTTLFSLNIFFGTVITYASYNRFNHNVARDSMIVTTLDMFTSVFAGLMMFSLLGNFYHKANKEDIGNIVRRGTPMAFVSFPDAVALFEDVPQVFAVLFFVLLFILGVGTSVALLMTVITVIRDNFPSSKYLVVAVVTCVLGFFATLVYVTRGGMYILALVDYYSTTFAVFILGTVEIIGLAWIYGVNNICYDVEYMLGHQVGLYMRICWSFITPVLMIVFLGYSLAYIEPQTYNDQPFPTEAYVAGWILFGIVVVQLPLWALIVMVKKRGGSFRETIKNSFQSSELWRPKNNAKYKEWKDFKERKKGELPDESILQKTVRSTTGYSTLKSETAGSSRADTRF